ncbi:MAG: OB-fold nucleic acid binding domain-containing protein [Actinomycetota bacterium]|nr:OB-fold nucleic acid binding domain-containing protein [Actinomycetota bacterium]
MNDPEPTPGRWKRVLGRLTEDESESESRDLQHEVASAGATAVSLCALGTPVQVAGKIRAVVLRPRAGVPTLEAELYDGSGTVTLIWLGRRRIRGVDPGRALVARGRLTRNDGRPTIYNPAYDLRPAGA